MSPCHLPGMPRGPHFIRNALLIGVAVALVLAGSYAVVTSRPAAQSTGVKVLTTFYPVYDYARNVGGDRINVSLLVPMTLDVHAFEPTPSSVQAVATAKVLIYNGAGLELAVVAAVLLGGVSIFGGRGALPGVIAGVILLASLQNALRLSDVSNEALNVVTGVLLIVSVLAPNLANAVRSAVQRRRHRTSPL